MALFYQRDPSIEDYWRGIILFGSNTATYKFALGRSLLDLANEDKEFVTLDELAVPFSRHICEHLKICDRQITQRSSPFIEACRKFNRNEISSDELINTTKKEGFRYVLDRFPVLDGQAIDLKFYEYERSGDRRGVRLRQELADLATGPHGLSLPAEIEARWRLVETAWNLNLPPAALEVSYDREKEELYIQRPEHRKSITACRGALSGYQQGWCFYCGGRISVLMGSPDLADVDHFIPHKLKKNLAPRNINGVWNLVLACQGCNRGPDGKFSSLADIRFLKKIHTRNEHYISSHHPLKETIIKQTGSSPRRRAKFLNDIWNTADSLRPVTHWAPQ